jgi:hypothetical protein
MSLISFLFPMLFEILGLMEYYHPRMQLRLQLARIMILNLLNLYSLIWALFQKINGMTKRLTEIKTSQENETDSKYTTPASSTTFPLKSSTPLTSTTSTYKEATTIANQPITESSTSFTTDDDEAFFASLVTEVYDIDNPNYFDTDPTVAPSSTIETSSFGNFFSNFTESMMGENITEFFYIDDNSNFTLEGNTSYDLFDSFNVSNFVNETISNISTAINSTNFEPIQAAYQEVQYSFYQQEHASSINMDHLNSSTKLELRKLCWETMFGQELVKLTVFDLVSCHDNLRGFRWIVHKQN